MACLNYRIPVNTVLGACTVCYNAGMTERYPEPTPQIEVYTVIEVTFRRGKGTPESGDVVRMVKAYYRDDGEFLFEIDPFPDKEPSSLTRPGPDLPYTFPKEETPA